MSKGLYIRTPEIRARNSKAHIGKIAWNKGVPCSEEQKKKISSTLKGHKRSPSSIKKQLESRKGFKHSLETKQKIRDANKGANNYRWQGGLTSKNKRIRQSLEYRLWRTAVFERDKYTCIWCGQHGGRLQADHIKQFAFYPELRFAIDNGRTLCIPCHRSTETWGKPYKL